MLFTLVGNVSVNKRDKSYAHETTDRINSILICQLILSAKKKIIRMAIGLGGGVVAVLLE